MTRRVSLEYLVPVYVEVDLDEAKIVDVTMTLWGTETVHRDYDNGNALMLLPDSKDGDPDVVRNDLPEVQQAVRIAEESDWPHLDVQHASSERFPIRVLP